MGHNNARGQKTHNEHKWNTMHIVHEEADDMTMTDYDGYSLWRLVVVIMVINFDDNSDYHQGWQ